MTKEEVEQKLKTYPAKILLLGIVKGEDGEHHIAQSISCTREETFEALKVMENARLFYLTESEKDAVYLKNESKKL